jgi:hypothetical protein
LGLRVGSLWLAECVGAGQMLPGNMITESGEVLDFQIETAHPSGAVTASNPRTGEVCRDRGYDVFPLDQPSEHVQQCRNGDLNGFRDNRTAVERR